MKNPFTTLKKIIDRTKSVPKIDLVKKEVNKPVEQVKEEIREINTEQHKPHHTAPVMTTYTAKLKRDKRIVRNRIQKDSRKTNR